MFQTETASDFSYVQLWLLHWIQVYSWASSLGEREKPTQEVLEDDAKFDAWHRNYIAKITGDTRAGYSPSRKTANSHKNVIKF